MSPVSVLLTIIVLRKLLTKPYYPNFIPVKLS